MKPLRTNGTTWLAMAVLALLAPVFFACGQTNSEVRVRIIEDPSSRPCLGAAHLEIDVILADGRYKYDEFGQFFSDTDYSCAVGQLAFPSLPLGNGISVQVTLYDSTTDAAGVLATGTSVSFNISSGSPIQQMDITLNRPPAIKKGTVIARNTPDDWTAVSGISVLAFKVTKQGDSTATRSGYISYDPVAEPNPFPLLISNLPEPTAATQYNVEIDGTTCTTCTPLRTWTGIAWLTPQQMVADVSLSSN